MARAAASDRSAFAALVQAHQGCLRKLLGRVCRGDQARADDLAQEAFVRTRRALPKFRCEALRQQLHRDAEPDDAGFSLPVWARCPTTHRRFSGRCPVAGVALRLALSSQ